MVAQAAGRSHDDVRALAQRAALLRGVHAADAGGDAGAGLAVEPDQLAADLERELAGRGDDQSERLADIGHLAIGLDQLRRHGEAEGDGLAGAGLRRDDEVAPFSFRLQHGGLDGGGRGIAAGGKGFAEHRRQ